MRKALLLLALLAAAAASDEIAKAQAIAKAGPEAARARIPELIAIGGGTPEERFAARDALVVAGTPALARLIGEAGGNPSLKLLLEGVSFDLGASVVAQALPLLANGNPRIRAMAAVSLGAAGKGGEAAVKQLVTALHDTDADVRHEAAAALGRIGRGAHDAIPGLLHLANDPERGGQRDALLAMGMIVRDAAEREPYVPKPPREVTDAIGRGLAWLARQQGPDGAWSIPPAGDARAPERVRAYVASLAALAMLESGAPDRPPGLRAALRYVVATDSEDQGLLTSPWGPREALGATLCAATRILAEPECRAGAARVLASDHRPGSLGWFALSALEAGFAGLRAPPDMAATDSDPVVAALVRLAAGKDPNSEELRRLIEVYKPDEQAEPDSWAFAARARWYGGVKSDDLVATIRKRQREDGSWDPGRYALGAVHATACMLLALEAASGLARPLTMPLPDAPQLKAAVATLRIAAQSEDKAIRAAAEQALAGFAVR